MKKILIVDGQGGKIGSLIIDQLKKYKETLSVEVFAIGTNSIATSNMNKAGADYVATGENPIIVNAKDADIIVGPIGIVIADSFLGEITPKMTVSISQSHAKKVLIPINRCNSYVVGIQNLNISDQISQAVNYIIEQLA